jgi:hypothetical protein
VWCLQSLSIRITQQGESCGTAGKIARHHTAGHVRVVDVNNEGCLSTELLLDVMVEQHQL